MFSKRAIVVRLRSTSQLGEEGVMSSSGGGKEVGEGSAGSCSAYVRRMFAVCPPYVRRMSADHPPYVRHMSAVYPPHLIAHFPEGINKNFQDNGNWNKTSFL